MPNKDKQKDREVKRRFIQRQREQGLCLECTNPVSEGHSRCETHLALRREYNRKRRKGAAKRGLCSECLSRPSLQHHKLCEVCYYRKVSRAHFGTITCWQQLKDKFDSQGGRCALSGFPLTLGVDAELDHIKPLATGGCKEVTNTQWVLHVVNRMKRDIPEAEFFVLIEGLYKHMKARRK